MQHIAQSWQDSWVHSRGCTIPYSVCLKVCVCVYVYVCVCVFVGACVCVKPSALTVLSVHLSERFQLSAPRNVCNRSHESS